MASTRTYLAIGTAVFLGNVAYHVFDSNDSRISSVESQVADIREEVEEIKQIVLAHNPISIKYTDRDVECLARNIYWEAGVEDMAGKLAVGVITVNRVRTQRWGRGICDVVYSKDQFSWTKVKKRAWVSLKGRTWSESKAAARAVLDGLTVKQLDKALFYHADYVRPNWRDGSKRVTKIGKHIFYTQAKGNNIKL